MNTTCPFTNPAPRDPARPAHAAHIAGAIRLTEIPSKNVPWLWPGRIPLGRVTLLVSDPGLGKSLVALDIAARVSSAAPWPDDGVKSQESRDKSQIGEQDAGSRLSTLDSRPPSSVLLLTTEDDLADTIRPRLEALGAGCSRIYSIAAIPGRNTNGDVPRSFALNRDLARLANLLDELPDCRLLVIDPISAYLGGANEHANAEIQNLLVPLATMARQRGLAVLAVSHLRKKDGAAIYRTMGSMAFVAVSRAAWVICKDPADANRRFFLPLKNNLAPDVTGLSYTIEASPTGRSPLIRWSPDPVPVTSHAFASARSPGRPDDERQHAIEWLRATLSKGPRLTCDIKHDAAAHGISYGTLRRAFRELGAEAVREAPYPFAQWMWKLPGIDAQNPGGEYCAPIDFLGDFADLFNYLEPLVPSSQPPAGSPQPRAPSP